MSEVKQVRSRLLKSLIAIIFILVAASALVQVLTPSIPQKIHVTHMGMGSILKVNDCTQSGDNIEDYFGLSACDAVQIRSTQEGFSEAEHLAINWGPDDNNPFMLRDPVGNDYVSLFRAVNIDDVPSEGVEVRQEMNLVVALEREDRFITTEFEADVDAVTVSEDVINAIGFIGTRIDRQHAAAGFYEAVDDNQGVIPFTLLLNVAMEGSSSHGVSADYEKVLFVDQESYDVLDVTKLFTETIPIDQWATDDSYIKNLAAPDRRIPTLWIWSTAALIFLIVSGAGMFVASVALPVAQLSENRAKKVAEQLQASESFNHALSHNMKNPIDQVVSGYQMLKVLIEEETSADEMEMFMPDIMELLSKSEKASRIREGLIDLVSFSSDVELETVDLNALIRDNITESEYVQPMTVENLPTIECDPDMMVQIIDQLLANADRHAQAPTRVYYSESDGICVEDAAGTFPQDSFDSLCEIGSKGNNSSGDGLGMYLILLMCEKHGWPFGVKVEEGVSTTFTIGVAV